MFRLVAEVNHGGWGVYDEPIATFDTRKLAEDYLDASTTKEYPYSGKSLIPRGTINVRIEEYKFPHNPPIDF